jgi:CheY-like chemotaxis protein
MLDSSRGHILLVDDDPLVLEALVLLLGPEGYALKEAIGSVAALQAVDTGFVPDVLIVDFNLEDETTGSELVMQLRQVLHHSMPVILLTASPERAELPWITDAPVWLARKPIPPGLLLASLPGLVQVARATRGAADVESPT